MSLAFHSATTIEIGKLMKLQHGAYRVVTIRDQFGRECVIDAFAWDDDIEIIVHDSDPSTERGQVDAADRLRASLERIKQYASVPWDMGDTIHAEATKALDEAMGPGE